MLKSLEELVNTIRDRKNSNSEKSYTSKLLNNKKEVYDDLTSLPFLNLIVFTSFSIVSDIIKF